MGDTMANEKKDISGYIIVGMVAAVIGGAGGYFLSGGSSGSGDYGTYTKRIKEARKYISEHGSQNFDDQKALKGMVSGYLTAGGDKYTYYYDTEITSETVEMTNEVNNAPTAKGSGFKVDKSESGNILLTEVQPGLAADRQGLKTGDEIIAIDGVSVSEQGYENYARKLLGKPDTEVRLTVQREGKEFEVNFKRDNKVQSEASYEKMGDKLYIRIRFFNDFTVGQINKGFEENGKPRSVILDLRDCPGGDTERAVDIAGYFIEKGKVTLDSYKDEDQIMEVKAGNLQYDVPVVVLTNENTASAAEIMTALLKNNKENCTQVGVKTLGKGIYQREYELESGGIIHYTAGDFYVDDTENWHGKGIIPDVEVEMDSKLIDTDKDVQLKKAIELLD